MLEFCFVCRRKFIGNCSRIEGAAVLNFGNNKIKDLDTLDPIGSSSSNITTTIIMNVTGIVSVIGELFTMEFFLWGLTCKILR